MNPDTCSDAPRLGSYPASPATFFDPEHESLLAAFDALTTSRPDAILVRYFDAGWTAAQIDDVSLRLAGVLHDGGVRAGDRVAILTQNDPQYMVALLASWTLGAIGVACSPMLTAKELTAQLRDAEATALVALDTLYDAVGGTAADAAGVQLRITSAQTDFVTGPPRVGPPTTAMAGLPGSWQTVLTAPVLEEDFRRRPSADDIALLTYTSGTTGPPKGAMMSHGNIMQATSTVVHWLEIKPDDGILAIAPLFHVTGLSLAACAVLAGTTLHLSHRFNAAEQVRLTSTYHPTVCIGPSTAYIALMDQARTAGDADLSSLTKCYAGGAPLPIPVVEDWRELTGTRLHNAYGLTETTSATHMTPLGQQGPVDPTSGVLSMGVPVSGISCRIIDEQGKTVPSGTAGEIAVRGPQVVQGYWRKPEETAAAFTDGEFRTGDIGVMDSNGWCFVVDRLKDLIVASGFKIWPREVEDALYEHPAVREVAVVGVPDDYRGEAVMAFVSLWRGGTATPEQLIAFARERLASHKCPRLVEILDDLPKTPSGKILRRELKGRKP